MAGISSYAIKFADDAVIQAENKGFEASSQVGRISGSLAGGIMGAEIGASIGVRFGGVGAVPGSRPEN